MRCFLFDFVLITFTYCLGQSVAASIFVLRHILFLLTYPPFVYSIVKTTCPAKYNPSKHFWITTNRSTS